MNTQITNIDICNLFYFFDFNSSELSTFSCFSLTFLVARREALFSVRLIFFDAYDLSAGSVSSSFKLLIGSSVSSSSDRDCLKYHTLLNL